MSCNCEHEKIIKQLDIQLNALVNKRIKFLQRISSKQSQVKNLERDVKKLFEVESKLKLKMETLYKMRAELSNKN